MANYTAADVKRLRETTAAGMMDCKKALVEADGDFEKAVEIIRVKGQAGVKKREGRSASNGLVTALLDGTTSGVLLELACETDFVAKSERFQQLAEKVVEEIAKSEPADVEALLGSEVDAGRTVRELLDDANATIGEKIEVRRFARLTGGYVAAYLHKTSPDLPPQIGVLVAVDGESPTTAKDIAQHVAAFAPTYVSRDDVPAETVENERRIAEATAREEGKPAQALPKIVEGRVAGFFKENVLVDQAFAKDPKKTVKAVLAEARIAVESFVRFRVGQP
jgi:elongation factor Ts